MSNTDLKRLPGKIIGIMPNLKVRNRVYRGLIDIRPPTLADRAYLNEEGLPDMEVDRRGYLSMPGRNRIRVARDLVRYFGEDACARVPGLYERDRDWSITGFKGIGVPVLDINRFVRAIVVRSVDEVGRVYHTLLTSEHKRGPGPGMPVHVPVNDATPFDRVALTDRALAADAVTVRTGTLCLAVHEAKNWEASVPLLTELGAREVVVGFHKGNDRWIAARLQEAMRQAGHGKFVASVAEGPLSGWLPLDGRGWDY